MKKIFICITVVIILMFTMTACSHKHEIVVDEAIAPTCTETGLTEGSHCSVCGEIIIEQSDVSPKGHNFINGKCSSCRKELSAKITIKHDGVMYSSYWMNILGEYNWYNPKYTIKNAAASLTQENGKIYMIVTYDINVFSDNQKMGSWGESIPYASATLWGDGEIIKQGMLLKLLDEHLFYTINETYSKSVKIEVPYAETYTLRLNSYED